jgi:hypothetical protein
VSREDCEIASRLRGSRRRSKPEEFDTLAESLKSLKTDHAFYVPGEHDVLNNNGAMFRERFGRNAMGDSGLGHKRMKCELIVEEGPHASQKERHDASSEQFGNR